MPPINVPRRQALYNQIAILFILLALALVAVLPFTGEQYWSHHIRLGTYIRQHQHEFEQDISLLVALVIFFWRGVVVTGIGVAMLPVLMGMYFFYRNPSRRSSALVVLLTSALLSIGASLAIKVALLEFVNRPVLFAGG